MAPGPLRGANPKGPRPSPASSRDPADGGRRAPSARQRRSLQDGACQVNSARLQIWLMEGVVDTIIADAGLALPDVRRKHTRRAKSARECFHADEQLVPGGSLEVAVNERALLGGLQRGPFGSLVLQAPCCGQWRRKRRGGGPWQRVLKLAVLEDYADPFDAAQVAGSQAGLEKVTENDGYMEPYEAQKMMAEIRQKGLREAPSRPLHLYDTPYEPVAGGLEADSDRPACPRPRESRLPEDDERPPEEYDQPWEWKKERISKAFAVEIKVIKDLPWPPPVGQLDSGETPPDGEAGAPGPPQHGQQNYEDANGPPEGLGYGRTSPCREEKARAGLRHGTSSLKSTKTLSAEPGPFLGERIDPALPLESQCWYHGAISRTDAETLLRLCKEASYLVRNSETSKNDFSLSLKSSQGFMHMKLSRTQENKYVLGQHSPPFDSVPEIIHHYASRKLPIKGAEHMSLLYPVAIRTL
uniref:Src homology 2 domain containing F n=1 Tax=Cairina moschata TaxID=8855 RepID=A0A8C3BGI1_CAIMO